MDKNNSIFVIDFLDKLDHLEGEMKDFDELNHIGLNDLCLQM